MNRIVVFIFLVATFAFAEAQTIFGKWKTIDPDTGKDESIIEVFKKDGRAFAKIIEIFNDADRDKTCIYCKGPNKDKPILGLVILNGLKKVGDEWRGGKILDPKNGNYYKCYITLESQNKMKLRGYIGIALFGRTEYWYRVE